MNDIPKDFITIKEALKRLKISKPTLYKHIKAGQLSKYKFFGKTLLRESEVAEHIKKGAIPTQKAS